MVLSYSNRINDTKDSKRYWITRWIRLFPVYFFALAIVMSYYYFIDNSFATSIGIRLPLEVLLIQSWIGKTSINYPGWSLSVEMFFYLLFPFLMHRIKDVKSKNLFWIFIAAYAIIQAAHSILFINSTYSNNVNISAFIYYSPYFHLNTFFLGMITGIIFLRNQEFIQSHKIPIKIAGYSMVISLFFLALMIPEKLFNIQLGLLTPVYAIFVFTFSIPTVVTNVLGNKFFIFLGNISYGIYILQFPLMLYTASLISNTHNLIFMLYYLVALIFISAIAYYYIEEPFIKFGKKITGSKYPLISRVTFQRSK